jgi:hypothetical protein
VAWLNKQSALLFKAGPGAYADIRKRGFSIERIGTIAGASGGAKWLVLSQIDRVIADYLLPRLSGPVHLIGSSIGSWRFACFAQNSPLDAVERFETAYLEQTYSEKPDAAEISAVSREVLRNILGNNGVDEIVTHPTLRTNIMTVRSRLLTATDVRPLLGAGLLAAMTANLASRRALGAFFVRGLFYDTRDLPPIYNAPGFPMERVSLTSQNLFDAIIASGSIPMVLKGVRNIAGAPPGIYRDGGIIDYHLDLPTSDPGRVTLFPHFFDWMKPGWFDRQIPWRKLNPEHTDRTVVVCPSPEFVATLPNQKVPDRTDFVTMSPAERQRVWRDVVAACRVLADEFHDVLERQELAARLTPL